MNTCDDDTEGAHNMQARQLAPADDEAQLHTATNTRTTILIVEDDTAARLTISALISNAGADAVAAKPINATELRAVVYAAVRMRRQYQSLIREDQAGS